MREARGYESLAVWKRGISLVRQVYDTTAALPSSERFGLIAQMRRAAVSVPSNIAEGHARQTTRDYAHFVSIAQGSLAELVTQLHICVELGYCQPPMLSSLFQEIDELTRMLNSIRKSLHEREHRVVGR